MSLLENKAVTLTTCMKCKSELYLPALQSHGIAVGHQLSSCCDSISKDRTPSGRAGVPKHWHFGDVHGCYSSHA